MNDLELRSKIDEHIELIKYSSRALKEAPERATSFLIMVAILLDAKRNTEEDLIKLQTLSTAAKSQAYSRSEGLVTDKKSKSENDETYIKMREGLETCEAKIKWLRDYIEMFNNAHLLYRQFSKE